MQKSASESLLIPFIKKNKTVILLALLLILGILLMLIPTGSPKNAGDEKDRDEEARVSELCAGVAGVGRCSVMLNMRDGEVVSAAVLCDGADLLRVESDVKELISSLYGIGYNRISVLKLSE